MPLKSNSGRHLALPDIMTYWPTVGISYQTAMMAVCGWEPQLHVPNGIKGQMRMKPSSNGSAYTLASPLSVSQGLLNHLPDGKWKMPWQAQHGTRLQSMQLKGRLCSLLHIQPKWWTQTPHHWAVHTSSTPCSIDCLMWKCRPNQQTMPWSSMSQWNL